MCLEQNKIKAIINFVESTHQYDINHQNINGDTILHIACSKGHTQLVSYLLTIGAEI
jgi:ankyrin repeat protein